MASLLLLLTLIVLGSTEDPIKDDLPSTVTEDPEEEEPVPDIFGGENAVKLTDANYEKLTHFETVSPDDWFVKFYAPWCGHCRSLAPVWEELAEALDGKINVGKLDVTQNERVGRGMNITRLPTLMLFRRGRTYVYPRKGSRVVEDMVDWVLSKNPKEDPKEKPKPPPAPAPEPEEPTGPTDVVSLTESNFDVLTKFQSDAAEEESGNWFIKFYAPWCGHCKALAPTWEEVATELKGKVNVAKVDVTTNEALGTQFGVKSFPTLIYFKDGKMAQYEGQRDKDALCEYAVSSTPTEDIPSGIQKVEDPSLAEDFVSDVLILETDSFEEHTKFGTESNDEDSGTWFIEFYAPWCGHCKKLAPTWEEVATELKGTVNVAKVDVTENRELGTMFGVKGFPTLLLFKDGKMEKYKGARSKDALCEYARTHSPMELNPAVPVVEDTDADNEEVAADSAEQEKSEL